MIKDYYCYTCTTVEFIFYVILLVLFDIITHYFNNIIITHKTMIVPIVVKRKKTKIIKCLRVSFLLKMLKLYYPNPTSCCTR